MPHLIEFYNKHADLRSKFEILAIHESQSLKTFAELDEKNKKTEEEVWKTKLPFPVLIDKEGRTVERYGIFAFPTLVLIDPEGNIVQGGSLELLKEKLGIKG
ncbi:MAG: hypothetical protein AKCLJLPJ_02591 [Fimbriimonadales bacterium]|nr:TlpA family protein disulfide reductase [Armatimonadota bacterium]MBV6504445.1 hypothetical protein [Fimbriimonadales bacterium]NOG93290.1 TlpA family protein disulfide reductase [Armatimonadota bacterium]